MSADTSDLRQAVQARREAITDHWYRAVAHVGFMTQSATDVRQSFARLTQHMIDLLFVKDFAPQQAQAIGATVASLVYGHAAALGRTQEVLAHHLVADLPPVHRLALHPRLSLLLSDIAVGFTRAVRTTVLAEQEHVRTALIEQRQQVERALREQEHRLRMVVRNVPIVLFALDCSGVVTVIEGKGLETLGTMPERILGQSILDLPRVTPQILENIHRALAGEAFTDIVEVDAWVFETRYAPLRNEQDQIVGMLAVGVDITEGRRLQGELEAMRSQHLPMIAQPLSGDALALSLTYREWDVIHLITAGKTNRDIALALSISTKTVEKHITSVYTKVGVHSRVDLTTWAVHHAALVPPEVGQR